MASVSLLEINDHTVAPHLGLLKRVCDPTSTSKPHITVRYFDKLDVPPDHLDTVVRHIDLRRPGSYKSADARRRVIFIRCDADQLVALEHKPHFPASEFHITLYEGEDAEFAKDLLDTLRRFEWMFRIELPVGTTLTHVELRGSAGRRGKNRPTLESSLENLFYEVTRDQLTWSLIDRLTNAERLRLAHAVCQSLHRSVTGFRRVVGGRSEVDDFGREDKQRWVPAIHLTPPELAREIANYAVSLLEPGAARVDFGDPAVGNGAFYAALLQVLPRSRIASAVGVDVNPRQVEAARSRWGHRGLEVVQADYLHLEHLQPRTLILANPPYLRHQDIPAPYKKQMRDRASVVMETMIDARSGQYVYFLILSHRWLADNGVAAWLVPSGFMGSQYGRGVRRYLTEEVALIRIHQFAEDDPQFENAKVLPAVIVFRKATPEPDRCVTLSSGGTLEAPESTRTVSVTTLKNEQKWSVSCRWKDTTDAKLKVGDLFSVRRGIATGANNFFILRREAAVALGLPEVALRPILPKSRLLKSDVIERDSDGWPAVEPQLCVIDCKLSEEEIALRFPRLWEYLATAESHGVLDRNLVRHRRRWYQQEERRPTMFLCTYMGRGNAERLPLRFIWNKSDAIATNAYLMMYPKEPLANVLERDPKASEDVYRSLQRATVSAIFKWARTYSGGLRKIEPRELLAVGLPGAPEWLLQIGQAGDSGDRLWTRWSMAGLGRNE